MRRKVLTVGLVTAVVAGALAFAAGTSQAGRPPATVDSAAAKVTTDPAAAADRAAAGGFDALAKGPQETFIRRSAVNGAGGLHFYAYERTYRGLPVVGGDAVVATDAAGNVRATSAAHRGGITVGSITPSVTAAAATATARAQLGKVRSTAKPTLVVLADSGRLAWEVLATGTRAGLPSKLHVYVDAHTGKMTATKDDVRFDAARGYYNGNITIDTTGGRLQDPTRSGLSCGNYTSHTVYSNGGTGTGTDLQTGCVDAYYAVEQEIDMLRTWLGRTGLSGSGQNFPLYVGLNDVNAYWDGSSGTFGHSSDSQRQATNIDVVGHEMGHAIFQYTSGGTGSGNENGGINESTGDIFGALTEHYANNPNDPPDYTVGEEVNLTGSGPIRYMYNPSLVGDPNCYSSSIPNTEVHSAAGPNNHWFYLVAVGSAGGGGDPSSPTCNNSSVTGVGIQHAGQIYMNALNLKTSSWRYVNVRTATLSAAVSLFGASSQECKSVKAAWDAVSVPAQSGEAQCTTGPSNDFSLAVSPTSGSVARGGSTTATVSTATTSGSAQTVNLTASGLPTGVTASFSPASVTSGGSSTLTLTASSTATTGAKAITVTGTGSSGTHTATYTVTVTSTSGNDFSVSLSPASATVSAGSSTSSSVATATTSGSAQTVNLTVSGAPTGVTASVSPSSVTSGGSATLNVSVASTAAAGTYSLTVTGAGTAATHTATFTLTIQGGGGGGCGSTPAWSATTPYAPGDKVSYNGHLWTSTWWSTGAAPGAPESWAVWSDSGAC
ncbi:M4 family metallopeptidase [Hamadaea tsunoensis]|uniref:M4 family metallopeptidase n=1 Tax=Hamadaea tsunoensis TaxID=53368 RepID=UPI00041CE903|nr:M4 family metallopeptidase [Hamadaea tsunoensis]